MAESATPEEIAAALTGSADTKLAENIATVEDYNAYRSWAMGVSGATLSEVKNSANAWLSYALNTQELIVNAPVDGDVTIDTFEDAATDGAFDFTVNVKDIAVGDGALEANIRKVFDIEGVQDVATGTFSADSRDAGDAAVFNNAAQIWNHDFYWNSLAPAKKGGEPSVALKTAIDAAFGSVDACKAALADAAVKRFGSGWAWLVAKT